MNIDKLERREFYSNNNSSSFIDGAEKYAAEFRKYRQIQSARLQAQLSFAEIGILERAYEAAKASGIVKLREARIQSLGWFDVLADDRKSNDDYRAIMPLNELPPYIPHLNKRSADYIRVPKAYRNKTFEGYQFFTPEQENVWKVFMKFGLDLPRGIFIHGAPGTGKSHLVAAYARALQAELTQQAHARTLLVANEALQNWGNQLGEIAKVKEQHHEFSEAFRNQQNRSEREWKADVTGLISTAKEVFPHQFTDVAYTTFEDLYEQRGDTELMNAVYSRRLVIIDDVHHHDNLARMEFIQELVERRCERQEHHGVAVITSNMSPEKLFTLRDGYPSELKERGVSRLKQMCAVVDFGEDDYRKVIAAKEDNALWSAIEE